MTEPTDSIPAFARRYINYYDGDTCRSCGREIDGDKLIRHIDHIIPRSLDGENAVFNLQPLCHECNLQKGNSVTPQAEALIELRKRRRRELLDYFQGTTANIQGNSQLRDPQEEGYIEVKDHFDGDWSLPALVVLPTGVGKSLLIATLPFNIARGRVLVVAPNLTIKDGLAETLSDPDENAYRKYGVLGANQRLPRVVVLESGEVNREDCLRADIVVTNVQQIQGWLPLFPSDFFDMIIVDEAHHVPADSWQNVNDTFPDAKRVYVTATPFRSDGQSIAAEEVHTTSLAEAMQAGYVKNVMRATARASEMTFTIEGEERELGLDDILEMREEAWFSRGVALSEPPNRTIAERAISILHEKRQSGVFHQIIAVACSIRHARELEVLFESYGLRATHVASRGMTQEERDERIEDFDDGKYDVIVHVGILGEGYDNENISIAAIFRPYRSTLPYAQFVGRAIRHISDGDADDNIAHVVDHVGLDLDEQWDYFKREEEQAEILGDLEDVDDGTGDGGDGDGGERDENRAEVTDEVIEGFDIDVFVEMQGVDPDEVGNSMEDLEEAIQNLRDQGLDVPDPYALKEQITDLNRPVGSGEMASPANRPDKERQARRKKLSKDIQKRAGRIVQSMNIDGNDDDLVELIGHGEESSNYGVVIRSLHRELNRKMDKAESNSRRNDWLIDEFREAESLLDEVEEELIEQIEAETPYRKDRRDFGFPPFAS
jgi:superfamily II DNA or RNA helicase